ncbi:branched-chain amino acid transport system II carrier protein [Halalkalibacter alkalisediminis]|uniref:Branched-chain amino acid transport system carrier protein n=1 Tax=Halalkalibacter alkalisediminis TaxID=935616 RepID=A0ABV6NKA4_9BACI|nr:branched-chain amino acid transport system II carrier protein [Halalkalibacter alkalisediminis]
MKQKLPVKEILALGFFMFALFLGAGNLIFPPVLGQQAGESIWPAIFGFLVTGVGLPLLAIITISNVGGDLDTLSQRVHKTFAVVFPVVIYLTIGPFFGIPRTGTVAYEVGVVPFLPSTSGFSLFVSTLIFFSITFWLALNPAKLVDRVGKILTPILFVLIVIISIRAFISPLGDVGYAAETYIEGAFFSGFLEGFLTMDAIAALVFGIVIINRIQEKGFREVGDIRSYTIKAGIIAGVGLSFVYIALAYIGATSVNAVGVLDNGGAILTAVTSRLFGPFGTILLAFVITGACLTTSIGLVSACGEFLTKRFKRVSYPVIIAVLCLFSFTMANLGLSQLISFSLPLLIAIYPITIVLISLSILHLVKPLSSSIYSGAIIGAGIVSIYDGLTMAGLYSDFITNTLAHLPLYTEGVGWLLPSLVGGLLGYLYQKR